MSFDFSTLITDRTQADVDRAKAIAAKIRAGAASASELAEFHSCAMKGAYNYTDLNRVTAAMDALKARLEGYGYSVPGYQRIKIPHPTAGGSRLPAGYIELAWIQSTGTQFVNSDFKPNQNTRVVMDAYMTAESLPSFFYGSRNSSYTVNYGLLVNSSGVRSTYNASTLTMSGASIYERARIDQNKNVCSVNDVTVTNTTGTFQSEFPLFLFASNEAGTAKYFGFIRMYSCQIYDNGTLVRDYVPCINPDGEVGLYDLVTESFFGNSGTDAFIAGDVVTVSSKSVSMTNLVADGSFENVSANWYVWLAEPTDTAQAKDGAQSLKLGGNALALTKSTIPITVGHKYYGREYIKTSGELTADYCCFEVIGDTDNGEHTFVFGWNRGNFPNWTAISNVIAVEDAPSSSYGLLTLTVNGSVDAWVDSIVLVDLTESFGAGFEPDKEWCDKYIPFFEGTKVIELPPRYEWKEYDAPTTGQMTVYLLNVSIIRSVLAVMETTPEVPADMVDLMVQEANDIEVILLDVYRQLNIMATTFIPCGEALCGGDNL